MLETRRNYTMDLYKIFESIKNASGRTDKEMIIKKNADNKLFLEVLKFLYDNKITTGLDKRKLNKEIKLDSSNFNLKWTDSLESFLQFVADNNTMPDHIVAQVQRGIIIFGDTKEGQEFLKEVLCKSYKCGISAKTINKALGYELIYDFKVQLAHSFDKYQDYAIKQEFALTEKLDGHRTLIEVNDKEDYIKFYTRQGHEIHGLDDIANAIRNNTHVKYEPVKYEHYILDGEIIANDPNIKIEDRFSETTKILRSDANPKKGLQFNAFDIIQYDEFRAGKSKEIYFVRYTDLNVRFHSDKYLTCVKHLFRGEDEDMEIIPHILAEHVAKGGEGLMLNTLDGYYQTKRTKDLLKIKEFKNADLEVYDVFEGTGQHTDSLGGILVDYKGYTVAVGSGFTHNERKKYWADPELIIGKIVNIQYFGESKNQKNDNLSLRFPVFKGIRDDKTVDDINIE